jgi:hypothetical protein
MLRNGCWRRLRPCSSSPGNPRYRKLLQRGPDGHITGFAERREAWDLVWARLP